MPRDNNDEYTYVQSRTQASIIYVTETSAVKRLKRPRLGTKQRGKEGQEIPKIKSSANDRVKKGEKKTNILPKRNNKGANQKTKGKGKALKKKTSGSGTETIKRIERIKSKLQRIRFKDFIKDPIISIIENISYQYESTDESDYSDESYTDESCYNYGEESSDDETTKAEGQKPKKIWDWIKSCRGDGTGSIRCENPELEEDLINTLSRLLTKISKIMEICKEKYSRCFLEITLNQHSVQGEKQKCFVIKVNQSSGSAKTLYKIPIQDLNSEKRKFIYFNYLLIKKPTPYPSTASFCAFGGGHSQIRTVMRTGLKKKVTSESLFVYGLLCNDRSCQRILYVGVTGDIGTRIDCHLNRNSCFINNHIIGRHVSYERVDKAREFFIKNVIVVILHVSDNDESLRNWEVFWQSVLRANVCFQDIDPPGCNIK